MKRFRKSFVEGLIVFLPFALTLYAIVVVFRFVYNLLAFGRRLVPQGVAAVPHFGLLIDLGTVLFSLLFIVLVGRLGRTLFGKAGIRLLARLIQPIPVLNSIYGGLRKILEMFFQPQHNLFVRPVIVPFPHDGTSSIGFITGPAGSELPEGSRREYYRVFVPTVPNPTSGFVILYQGQDTKVVDLTPEQVAKLILSGGLLQEDQAARRKA
jgi:uncharacterized membrane protein